MPKTRTDTIITGIFLIALVLGGAWLLARKPARVASFASNAEDKASNRVKYFPVVEDISEGGRAVKHYSNTEVWDIDWTEDGLPKRVTIHRDAIQT